MYQSRAKSSGQAIVAAMALILVGGVVLFLVFNAGRTVNEKINLVNAADAAAYSGAQVVARDLNYLAYTNRAMIANEIVVGHMVSYQAEWDTILGAMQNPGGILGFVLNWLSANNIPLGFGIDDIIAGIEDLRQALEVFSGLYILNSAATTQLYAGFQEEVVKALSSPINGSHPVISVMEEVAQQYVQRPGISINVNDKTYLNQLISNGLEGVNDSDPLQADYVASLKEKADRALNISDELCKMIVFARPVITNNPSNGNGGLGGSGNGYCNSNGNSNASGSVNNPVRDRGMFADLIRRSMDGLDMANWIKSRDANYGNLLTWRVERKGSTDLKWSENGNGNNGYLTWEANDSIKSTAGILHLAAPMDHTTTTDAGKIADASSQYGGNILLTSIGWLTGACGKIIKCSTLAGQKYKGTERYVVLNDYSQPIKITAFLTHNNCNDTYGRDSGGVLKQGWNDDQGRFGSACNSPELVAAVSEAEVLYRRPSCGELSSNCAVGFASNRIVKEQPNLFNPFWQAKLAN